MLNFKITIIYKFYKNQLELKQKYQLKFRIYITE